MSLKICPKYRTSKEFLDCEIIATPGKYDFKPIAMGYQKNSPYAQMFDFYFDQMRQSGLRDQIRLKYFGSPQICPDIRLVVKPM